MTAQIYCQLCSYTTGSYGVNYDFTLVLFSCTISLRPRHMDSWELKELLNQRGLSLRSHHIMLHALCTPIREFTFVWGGCWGGGDLQEQKVRYSLQTGWLQPKRVTHTAWETIQSAGISLAWLGWRRIPMTDFCVKKKTNKTKNRSDLFNVCHLSFPMTAVMSLSFQFSFTLARTKPPLPKIIGDDWRGERSLPSQRDSLPQDLPHISFRSHVSANFSSLHLEPKEKKLKTNKACNNSFRTCYSLFNLQLKLPYFPGQ